MNRRALVVVAGWLAAAVLATGVGIAAIRVVANDLSGPSSPTVTEDDLRRRLNGATPSPTVSGPSVPVPGSSPSTSPPSTSQPPTAPGPTTPSGRSQVLTSVGGSVLARCSDGLVSLDWWTPAQGYAVDHVERGPAAEVKVEFEADHEDVELRIRCVDGVPTARLD